MRRFDQPREASSTEALLPAPYDRLTDYHIHTPLCKHAEGDPWEYAARARELGMSEIGISDHIPMPDNWDERWRMAPERMHEYLALVEDARRRVPEVTVRLGIEADYVPRYRDYIETFLASHPFDYVLGSVHYIGGWMIDNLADPGVLPGPTVDDWWRVYFEFWREAVESGLYDIMAHPDIVKIRGDIPEGDLRRFFGPALESCARRGVAIEVSTAGLHRPVREIYPGRQFLTMAREMGVAIVVNSDAHRPAFVGRDFDRAIAWIRECGYREVARYENRRRTMTRLDASSEE